MIQLYSPTNTEYSRNGDVTLMPSSATVHAILNGAWTAELTHPIDPGGRWKYIVDNAVIKMPSFNGDQLFRIRQREVGQRNHSADGTYIHGCHGRLLPD